jgi:hypothetical protein
MKLNIAILNKKYNHFVTKHARVHIDTRFSDTAKHRNMFSFRYLRSADKQLSVQDPDIPVTFCVICDWLLFWDVIICEWH